MPCTRGRTYQVSDIKHEFSSGGYVAVRVVASCVVAILAISFCSLSGYGLEKTGIILILVTFKIIEAIADAFYGILQIHDRLYVAGKSLVMKAVLSFIGFVVVDLLTKNILYGSVVVLVVNLVVILLYDIWWVRRVETVPIHQIRRYIREALVIMRRTSPVFVVIFLTMFSLNVPRYFLDQYHPQEIGYFGIMAMPITLLALFISFLIQPNIVIMAKLLDKRDMAGFHLIVRKLVTITIGIGVVALAATHLVGIFVLEVIFSVRAEQFHWELVVMVAGAVANALVSIYVNTLIVMRLFKWQFYTLLITNITSVGLSYWLVDSYAMMGSVVVFAGISLVQAVILAAYCHTKNFQKV